jgi:4-hydroxymandelate oxidase
VKPEGLDAEETRTASLQAPIDEVDSVLDLNGFEALARRAIAPDAFDYFAGGAGDEITLRENVTAFSGWRLRPRVLVDVSKIDLTAEVLGVSVGLPVGVAPTALQGLAHPDGEVATARAAAAARALFCLSTLSSRTIEDVAQATARPSWFQLYVHKDRSVARSLIERAEASGFDALVVTVDLPVVGYRQRDLENGFVVAPELYANLTVPEHEGRPFHEVVGFVSDPALTWADLEWLREVTSMPLVVKGILSPEDAELAVQHGADAVIVSNHGGRQLDRAISSIDALDAIVQTTAGRAEVYLDGGVRRGSDVVLALALGARGVFIGRPFLFALAGGGPRGVARALELIAAEVENAMALLGARRVEEIHRTHVTRV